LLARQTENPAGKTCHLLFLFFFSFFSLLSILNISPTPPPPLFGVKLLHQLFGDKSAGAFSFYNMWQFRVKIDRGTAFIEALTQFLISFPAFS
jgi:hypothetical protein